MLGHVPTKCAGGIFFALDFTSSFCRQGICWEKFYLVTSPPLRVSIAVLLCVIIQADLSQGVAILFCDF